MRSRTTLKSIIGTKTMESTTTVAIVGTRTNAEIFERIDTIVRKGYKVAVGDDAGFDVEVQEYLRKAGYITNVVVHYVGKKAKRNLGFAEKGGYASANIRDIQICKASDYILVAKGKEKHLQSLIDSKPGKARVVDLSKAYVADV
jgi:hypothetical protein